MKLKLFIIISVFIIIVSVSIKVLDAKGENMKVDLSELKAVPQGQWDALANKKIYFGHQSVGYNIIDGIKDIMVEMPDIKLNIVETRKPNDFNQGIFAHSPVGANCKPLSKVDDFKKIMDSGVGAKVDIAFFKFCYVDVVGNTDINQVFDYYVKIMQELQVKYPKVRFVHMSVPLNSTPTDIKAKIKRMLGKSTWTDEDNIKRNEFNQKLVEKLGDKVFNLAKYEATKLDCSTDGFNVGNKKYLSMVPEYTEDGGHLNKIGREAIGSQLLIFLKGIVDN